MLRVSTKEAARRFHRLLKTANDEGPVFIERYGRTRAVIMSAHHFSIVEKILKREKGDLAAHCLEAALGKIADGHFNKALKLKNAALLLGGLVK